MAPHRHNDETVRIWDAATGEQRATLTGHRGQVWTVAIAPDGTWLATGSQDKTARIWNIDSLQSDSGFAERISMDSVAFAPDGTWLAAGGDDGTVRIVDATTGKHRATQVGTKRGWLR